VSVGGFSFLVASGLAAPLGIVLQVLVTGASKEQLSLASTTAPALYWWLAFFVVVVGAFVVIRVFASGIRLRSSENSVDR
jgi:hypothetical protein